MIEILMSAYTLRNHEVHQLQQACQGLEKKVSSLEAEITRLKELLHLQQHGRFGKKSEASPLSKEENLLSSPPIPVAAHTRKQKVGRQLDFRNLPRYRVVHDLTEVDKMCTCCQQPLQVMGQDVREQLEIIPAKYSVIEHVRMKYRCRQCQTVVMAPQPCSPIPKAIAGGSVIADVLVNKYQYHLPLYRQSKIMASSGIHIPDNTLGNWVMQAGDGLVCLYDALWCILKTSYLQVDETPVKILEPDKKGYLWTYFAPHLGRGVVVFEISETRSADVANARLAPFNGLLQTDGYAGYNTLRHRKGIVGLGCWSHARRKFHEVVKITGNQEGVAAQMLERLKPLYALEARMRARQLDFRTRKRLRQKIARPILQAIHRWLRTIHNDVPPQSKLGQAMQYTLNQWKYLTLYLRHGQAEIDTNLVENKIREVALGKKNWLFMGSTASGKIHALYYSLVLSCVLNDINPRVYLHYVLTQIHALRQKLIDPMDLLPHTIDLNLLQVFANAQIDFAKQVFTNSS